MGRAGTPAQAGGRREAPPVMREEQIGRINGWLEMGCTFATNFGN